MAQEVVSNTGKREKPQLQVVGTSWSQIHLSNQFHIFDMRLAYHQLLRTLIFHQPGPACWSQALHNTHTHHIRSVVLSRYQASWRKSLEKMNNPSETKIYQEVPPFIRCGESFRGFTIPGDTSTAVTSIVSSHRSGSRYFSFLGYRRGPFGACVG